MSGGNQQRVNIAIGLLGAPAVLLLDEPSASLDPRQRERLWEFISTLAGRGTTVVYSTHNVSEVERYADRVLLLADGELLFTGTPSELERAVGGDARDFEAAFVLNNQDPVERQFADQAISQRLAEVEQAVSKQVLRVAVTDLRQVLNGGSVQILGQKVGLLGLRNSRTIVQGTVASLPVGSPLRTSLDQVVGSPTWRSRG